MPCRKGSETWRKLMASVRRSHPTYSLKRRKRIVNAVWYQKIRKKKR